MPNTKYILLVGNPINGYAAAGIFDTGADAAEWGEQNLEADPMKSDWWLVELEIVNSPERSNVIEFPKPYEPTVAELFDQDA